MTRQGQGGSRLDLVSGVKVPEPALDVVFIHGLDGDAVATWSTSGGVQGSWLQWLAEDHPSCRIWTASYPASSTRWRGAAMALHDRAENLAAVLEANGIGSRPTCFIGHSLGGLLIKLMVVEAASGQAGLPRLRMATKGVIFLATPHDGSRLAGYAENLRRVYRSTTVVAELRSSSPILLTLGDKYRDAVASLGIRNLVFFETLPMAGQTIVEAASANPGLLHTRRIPIDANHSTISKPLSRRDVVYMQTSMFLSQLVDASLKQVGGLADVVERGTSSAEPSSPTRRLALQSVASEGCVLLNFHNLTGGNVDVFWVSLSGETVLQESIASGGAAAVEAKPGQTYVVRDRAGALLRSVTAGTNSCPVDIRGRTD